jgi:hypothetical protein
MPIIAIALVVLVFFAYSMFRSEPETPDVSPPSEPATVRIVFIIEEMVDDEYKLYADYVDIEATPGMSMAQMLESGMKSNPVKFANVSYAWTMYSGASINRIMTYDNTVEIDFDDIPTAHSAGSEAYAIVEAIALTVFANYDAETVHITVNGQLFTTVEKNRSWIQGIDY